MSKHNLKNFTVRRLILTPDLNLLALVSSNNPQYKIRFCNTNIPCLSYSICVSELLTVTVFAWFPKICLYKLLN